MFFLYNYLLCLKIKIVFTFIHDQKVVSNFREIILLVYWCDVHTTIYSIVCNLLRTHTCILYEMHKHHCIHYIHMHSAHTHIIYTYIYIYSTVWRRAVAAPCLLHLAQRSAWYFRSPTIVIIIVNTNLIPGNRLDWKG